MNFLYNLLMKKIFSYKITKHRVLHLGTSIYIILSLLFIVSIMFIVLSKVYLAYGMSLGQDELIDSILTKFETEPCYPIEVYSDSARYTLLNINCLQPSIVP